MEEKIAQEGGIMPTVEQKENSPSLKEKAARALGVGLVVGAGTLPDTKAIQASEIQQHLDSRNKIEQFEKQGMPSANALAEAGFQIGGPSLRQGYGGQGNPDVQSHSTGAASKGQAFRGKEAPSSAKATEGKQIEASQTITETLQNLTVTREWLEQNPQSVVDTTYVKNTNNETTAKYVLHSNGRVYKTELGTNGKFEKYVATSQETVPIENLKSLAISNDGQTIVVTGEDPLRSGVLGIAVSYNKGKTWTKIDTPSPISGVGHNVIFIDGTVNKFLLSTASAEFQSGRHVFTAQSQNETILSTGITGSSSRIMVTETNGTEIKLISLKFGASGVNLETIDYQTGTASSENIGSATINGTETNLGSCEGIAMYADANGDTHFLTSNPNRGVLYDVNLTTRTGKEFFYESKLNNKGIENYVNNTFTIWRLYAARDNQGNVRVSAGASYTSSVDSAAHAVLTHFILQPNFDIDTFSLLAPNIRSSVSSLRPILLPGQIMGLDIGILLVGKALRTINPDGSPDSNPTFYTDNGLGENPPTPTPTPTPNLPFRMYIPDLYKNLVTSSWRKVKKRFGIVTFE